MSGWARLGWVDRFGAALSGEARESLRTLRFGPAVRAAVVAAEPPVAVVPAQRDRAVALENGVTRARARIA